MVEAVLDLKRWGNNLRVRLPAAEKPRPHICVSINACAFRSSAGAWSSHRLPVRR